MFFCFIYVSEVPKGKKIARWFSSHMPKLNRDSQNTEVRFGLACYFMYVIHLRIDFALDCSKTSINILTGLLLRS